MIIESLWVLLFGMVGVFFVMGIIILSLIVLKRFAGKPEEDGREK